jgi:hypothetical protein
MGVFFFVLAVALEGVTAALRRREKKRKRRRW